MHNTPLSESSKSKVSLSGVHFDCNNGGEECEGIVWERWRWWFKKEVQGFKRGGDGSRKWCKVSRRKGWWFKKEVQGYKKGGDVSTNGQEKWNESMEKNYNTLQRCDNVLWKTNSLTNYLPFFRKGTCGNSNANVNLIKLQTCIASSFVSAWMVSPLANGEVVFLMLWLGEYFSKSGLCTVGSLVDTSGMEWK